MTAVCHAAVAELPPAFSSNAGAMHATKATTSVCDGSAMMHPKKQETKVPFRNIFDN